MASLLPNGKQQFISADGVPLAAGSVYFYVPSTTTPKDTWQDSGQTTLNTNPIILDAAGEAVIYGSGTYRQIVYDALGNLIWDQLTSDGTSAEILTKVTSGSTFQVVLPGILEVNKSASSPTTIMMPASPSEGFTLTVKDGKGDASTNLITVNGNGFLFDGESSFFVGSNYQSITAFFDGSNYIIL